MEAERKKNITLRIVAGMPYSDYLNREFYSFVIFIGIYLFTILIFWAVSWFSFRNKQEHTAEAEASLHSYGKVIKIKVKN